MVGLAYELGFPRCKPLKRNDEEEEENGKDGETLRCSGLCILSITIGYTVNGDNQDSQQRRGQLQKERARKVE